MHNLNSDFSLDSSHCETHRYSKQHELPFTSDTYVSQELFELIYSEFWESFPVDSPDGFKYFVTFVEDKSHTTLALFATI